MSEVKVNKISPRTNCGTVTLGDSGDTIALGSGATQTGFGRTGTVNWVTTKKTTSFTAANGEGYFVDTAASGAVTMTLPSSPSAGSIVGVKDYNGNFASANLTIGRGGSPINGANVADPVIKTSGASIFLVYVDASQGWVATQDDSSTFAGEDFITATGGTASNCGDFKIHTFTGPGTFTVSSASSVAANNLVDYLVVAGGGGGGAGCGGGGGGGAGGFRFFANTSTNPQSGPGAPRNGYGSPSPSGTAITVSATAYPITVGGGGAGGTVTGPSSGTCGQNGNPSVFSTVTSTAGGGAGSGNTPAPTSSGNPGGSGGGATRNRGSGGTGNTPSVTPSQGSNGGDGSDGSAGDGGGGAMAVGEDNSSPALSGDGGAGAGVTGFGASNGECSSCVQYFAGGGGGGSYKGCAATPTPKGAGGIGGGGRGGLFAPLPGPQLPLGEAGTANTGGGGGGGTEVSATDSPGGAGGSGIVVIRYKFK